MSRDNFTVDHGLIVDETKSPPQCAGYIFNFQPRGAYDPGGVVKVGGRELTQAEIDRHNDLLAQAEWEALLKRGKGVLYLTHEPRALLTSERRLNYGCYFDGTLGMWTGKDKVKCRCRLGYHNIARTRTDCWFKMPDGTNWYGVNVGDSQICRVRRCKK